MRDAVTVFLDEACAIADTIEPLSMYSFVFEAIDEDQDAGKVEASNAKKESESKSFLQKAIDAIKGAIERLKAVLRNFREKRALSGEDRKEYEEFCKEVKNNPEFKNKKVTVTDWQIIRKQYDSVLKEIETEIEKVKRTDEECKPTILHKLEEKVAGLGTTAKNTVIQITLDQLVAKAKWDEDFAQKLDIILTHDFGALDALTKDMNNNQANKARRKIHSYASQISLRRLLMKFRQKRLTVEQQAQKEYDETRKSLRKSIFKSRKYVDKDLKKRIFQVGRRVIADTTSEYIKDKDKTKENNRALRRYKRAEKANKKAAEAAKEREERRDQVNDAKKKLRHPTD